MPEASPHRKGPLKVHSGGVNVGDKVFRILIALTDLGLILFGVTLLLNIVARLLIWCVGREPASARS